MHDSSDQQPAPSKDNHGCGCIFLEVSVTAASVPSSRRPTSRSSALTSSRGQVAAQSAIDMRSTRFRHPSRCSCAQVASSDGLVSGSAARPSGRAGMHPPTPPSAFQHSQHVSDEFGGGHQAERDCMPLGACGSQRCRRWGAHLSATSSTLSLVTCGSRGRSSGPEAATLIHGRLGSGSLGKQTCIDPALLGRPAPATACCRCSRLRW